MTGNPLLLLKYELELFSSGEPFEYAFHDTCKDPDIVDKLQYVIDRYYVHFLQFHIWNGSHKCLIVSFSDETAEMEDANNTFHDWKVFDRRIMDAVLKELHAYERQEFEYREIVI